MTAQELAKLQRDYLILTEKQSAARLDAEFERVRREIAAHLRSNLTPDVDRAASRFVAEIIALLNSETEKLALNAASIVARAQNRVIDFAGESLKRFFPKISTSIFSPDKEAIQNLIGRTQTGKSLVGFFKRFQPAVAEAAQKSLIEGFAAGDSSVAIARRMAEATGGERYKFLTVARTETNEAYRAASREFYESADIKRYVWLSVLDPRTCLTCWHLHGRMFKTSVKIFAHPNCRCVMVPLIKGQTPIATGAEKFLQLEIGFQKQILGAKRYEMFQGGKSFDEFVLSRKDVEYGERFFIKNVSDLSPQK